MKYISLEEKYTGLGFFAVSISETRESLHIEINGTGREKARAALARVFADYPNIQALDLQTAELDDLSVFQPLQNLRKLCFSPGFGGYGDWPLNAAVKDVSPLRDLPMLDSLAISFGGDALGSFAELRQIRDLKLSMGTDQPDLEAVGKLVQLEKLELSVAGSRWSRPRINSIAQLAGLRRLKSLSVNHLGLKSLAPVKNMLELQCLYCSNNLIRSLNPLEKLSELRELDASCNKSLRDASVLRKLPRLTKINLRETSTGFPPDVTLAKKDEA